jgi:hypothetical protein
MASTQSANIAPRSSRSESRKRRPRFLLRDVMDDVRRWVCAFPKLSGIWIDEYCPRLEITKRRG